MVLKRLDFSIDLINNVIFLWDLGLISEFMELNLSFEVFNYTVMILDNRLLALFVVEGDFLQFDDLVLAIFEFLL